MLGGLIEKGNILAPLTPMATPPRTFAETAELAYADQVNRLNVSSSAEIMKPLREEQLAAFKQATGADDTSIYDTIGASRLNVKGEVFNRPASEDEFYKKLDAYIDNARTLDERFKNVPTTADLEKKAYEKVAKAKAEYEQSEFTGAFAEYGGALAGSMQGYLSDPVQASTMILTAPIGGGVRVGSSALAAIMRTAATEAAVNAGITAVEQVPVYQWNQRLGVDYGLDDAAMNILMAGSLGALIPATVTGAKPAFNLARSSAANAFGMIADNPRIPSRVRDAAALMERHAHIEEAMPFPRDLPDAERVHFENVAKAEADILNRQPIEVKDPFLPDLREMMQPPPARQFSLGEPIGARYPDYTVPTPAVAKFIDGMVSELRDSTAGARIFLEQEGAGSTPVVIGQKSTSPEWFQLYNKSVDEQNKARAAEIKRNKALPEDLQQPVTPSASVLTKKKFEAVAEKMKQGLPLGKEEARVAEFIYNTAQEQRTRYVQDYVNFRADRQAEYDASVDALAAREGAFADDSPASELPDIEMLEPVIMAEAERLALDSPDFKLVDDDGAFSMRELLDALKEDERFVNEIRTCAI